MSKARCEVDASAAKAAAEAFAEAGNANESKSRSVWTDWMGRGSEAGDGSRRSQVLEPVRGVVELIRLTVTSVASAGKRSIRRLVEKAPGGSALIKWTRSRRDNSKQATLSAT